MAPTTPYSEDLAGRDPLDAMSESATRIRALTETWSAAEFDRTYAPGKWTARQILIHLAQSEIALGNRARMALATPNYVAQAFDQDVWMAKESSISGPDAVDALLGISAMNRAFFAGLSASDRQKPFSHPEYGALTVDWLVHQMAGHLVHHVKHLEAVSVG